MKTSFDLVILAELASICFNWNHYFLWHIFTIIEDQSLQTFSELLWHLMKVWFEWLLQYDLAANIVTWSKERSGKYQSVCHPWIIFVSSKCWTFEVISEGAVWCRPQLQIFEKYYWLYVTSLLTQVLSQLSTVKYLSRMF